MATRNPPWNRDELIVTLDFYLRHTPSIPGKKSSEISELSGLLVKPPPNILRLQVTFVISQCSNGPL